MRKSCCPKCEAINSSRTVTLMVLPPMYYVECQKCGARTGNCATSEEAAERWRRGWLKMNWGV